MTTTDNQTERIRDQHVALMIATKRLLDMADGVRRQHDELMRLVRESPAPETAKPEAVAQ